MNFQNVYWDWPSMQTDNHSASMLAIGDSWFWYPFPGGSLVTRLGPLGAPKLFSWTAETRLRKVIGQTSYIRRPEAFGKSRKTNGSRH